MSAIEASSVRMQTMADGTLRMVVDIEPRHARDAFGLFGTPGTALALAALKPAQPQGAAPKPTGGPLAKLAGRWCNDPAFQRMCSVNSPQAAADVIREECDIESRAELDHNPAAAELFRTKFRVPFQKYMLGRGG